MILFESNDTKVSQMKLKKINHHHFREEYRMRAIICGHTGATGQYVLEELVKAPWITSVVTIGRRELAEYKNNKKVTQIIISDLCDLSGVDMKAVGKVDVAFDLVATTVKDAFKGEEVYRKVDVEMTSEFARFAKKAGATFLSAIGMEDMSGKQYSSRAKRDFENYARTLNFERLAFMHPKWVNREKYGSWYENFYTLFGLLGTKASHMARCIVWAAKNQKDAEKIYSIKEIKQIGMNPVK